MKVIPMQTYNVLGQRQHTLIKITALIFWALRQRSTH